MEDNQGESKELLIRFIEDQGEDFDSVNNYRDPECSGPKILLSSSKS